MSFIHHILCRCCAEQCDCGEGNGDDCKGCSTCWELHNEAECDGCELCEDDE